VVARILVIASVLWPVAMAAAVRERVEGKPALWTMALYAAGSRICHQRPDRSFQTSGVQWPVCARCAGLYASAPFGAFVAVIARRRRASAPVVARHADSRFLQSRTLLALAAVPTMATLVVEWGGLAQPGNPVRALAAIPLGAAIAFVLVTTARQSGKTDRIH
jgi:uncharacterized membrane protein